MKGLSFVRSALVFVAGLVIGAIGIGLVTAKPAPAASLTYSTPQLLNALGKGEIRNASWQDTTITGDLANGRRFKATVPDIDSVEAAPLIEALRTSKSDWRIEGLPLSTALAQTAAIVAFPMITFTVILLFLGMAILAIIRLAGRGGTPPRLQH